jgi:transcription antitermination factor NusG
MNAASTHLSLPLSDLSLAPWWVIHTRPRCEKKMDQWFAARGLTHYLPLRNKSRAYPGKRVVFQHPLFPGYAFGAFSLRDRNAVYSSGHAAAVLEVADQARFTAELSAIRIALAAGFDLEECTGLAPGRRARISTGKLRGLEGTILRRAGRTKLVLTVELLQRSVAVEIEPDWLELLA